MSTEQQQATTQIKEPFPKFWFKYTFEDDTANQTEYAFMIAPKNITWTGLGTSQVKSVAIFQKEEIIKGLESNKVNRNDIEIIYYKDPDIGSFTNMLEEFEVDVSQVLGSRKPVGGLLRVKKKTIRSNKTLKKRNKTHTDLLEDFIQSLAGRIVNHADQNYPQYNPQNIENRSIKEYTPQKDKKPVFDLDEPTDYTIVHFNAEQQYEAIQPHLNIGIQNDANFNKLMNGSCEALPEPIDPVFNQINSVSLISPNLIHKFSNMKELKNQKQKSYNDIVSRRIHMAFLYAEPLVYKEREVLKPFDMPLDSDIEFKEIIQNLKNINREFIIRKDAVSDHSLQNVILDLPYIIHISCHGDYDNKLKQYFLAFEDKDTGVMCQFSESDFINLLGNKNKGKIKLAFVSACHSEKIGKIFKQAEIPVVIAVNQNTMILDDTCKIFEKHFYTYLLKGTSPKSAYEYAQNIVKKDNKIDKYSCCCAHSHTNDCKWYKFGLKHGFKEAHNLHDPTCKCKTKFLHSLNCKIYQNFNNTLYPDPSSLDDVHLPSMEPFQKLCCCRHDIPHDESIKFVMLGDEKDQNKPIFQNKLKAGELLIDNDVNQKNKLLSMHNNLMIQERQLQIYSIVERICSSKPNQRFIHIFGGEGLGKSAMTNYAVKYALDRRKIDNAYYINCESNNKLIPLICQTLGFEKKNSTIQDICDMIRNNHLVIIFDKCGNQIKQNIDSFNSQLKHLINYTIMPKIIVITRKQEDIHQDYIVNKIEIKELERYQSAALLLKAVQNEQFKEANKNIREFAKHQIFSMIPGKPEVILKIANLLETNTLDQIIKEKFANQMLDKAEKKYLQDNNQEFESISWLIKMEHDQTARSFKKEIDILYLLSQLDSGLFNSDLKNFCILNSSKYQQWQQFLEQKCSTNKNAALKNEAIQNKSVIKEQIQGFQMINYSLEESVDEFFYIANTNVVKYVNDRVLRKEQRIFFFEQSCMILAQLSRKILRSLKIKRKIDIDLKTVTAEIDLGMFCENNQEHPLSEKQLEGYQIKSPKIRYMFNESNFIDALSLDKLKGFYDLLPYDKQIFYDIDAICQNVPSILVMLDSLEDALDVIEKFENVFNNFNIKYFLGKLLIIKASILLKKGEDQIIIKRMLKQANENFMFVGLSQGQGEAQYLESLALISLFEKNHMKQKFIRQSRKGSVDDFCQIDTCVNNSRRTSFKMLNNPCHSLSIEMDEQQFYNIKEQFEEIMNKLEKARHYYGQTDHQYGLAKSFMIEAEFRLDLIQSISNFNNRENLERIEILLEQAYEFYQRYSYEYQALVIKCLKMSAILQYEVGKFDSARQLIEKAITQAKQCNDKKQESQCIEVQSKIFIKMVENQSLQQFIFVKAHPLVEKQSHDIVQSGLITRFPSQFKQKITNMTMKTEKVINIKFDILSMEILDYITTNGCKILYISSLNYSEDELIVEQDNGLAQKISLDELKYLFQKQKQKMPQIECVIIAQPLSINIGKLFVELGVKNVISFNFTDFIKNDCNEKFLISQVYTVIHDFCVRFIENIINEKSVQEAFQQAKPVLSQQEIDSMISDKVYDSLSLLLYTEAVLLPENHSHSEQLIECSSSLDSSIGECIDSSRFRAPSNLQQFYTDRQPISGRQIEMYHVLCDIQSPDVKLVNINGIEGIGKTVFAKEILYYLKSRYQFLDGIYYIDLQKTKTIEQIKQKLFEQIYHRQIQVQDIASEFKEKNILIAFDNIDIIMQNDQSSFNWFMIQLLTECKMLKVILISKEKLIVQDFNKISQSIKIIELQPLSLTESVETILSNCARNISMEEIQEYNTMKLQPYDFLKQFLEQNFERNYNWKGRGNPKHLIKFAKKLQLSQFDEIEFKDYKANDNQDSQQYNNPEQEELKQNLDCTFNPHMDQLNEQGEQINHQVMEIDEGNNQQQVQEQDEYSYEEEDKDKILIPGASSSFNKDELLRQEGQEMNNLSSLDNTGSQNYRGLHKRHKH